MEAQLRSYSLDHISKSLHIGKNPASGRPLRRGAILNMITRVIGEKIGDASPQDAEFARRVLSTLPISDEARRDLQVGTYSPLTPISTPQVERHDPTTSVSHRRRHTDVTHPDRTPRGERVPKAHLETGHTGTPVRPSERAHRGPVVAGGIRLRERPEVRPVVINFDGLFSDSDTDSVSSDDSSSTYGARPDVHYDYTPYTTGDRREALPEHDPTFTGEVEYTYSGRHVPNPKPTFKDGTANEDDLKFLSYDTTDGKKKKLTPTESRAIIDILKRRGVLNASGKVIDESKLSDESLKREIQGKLPETVGSKVGFTNKLLRQIGKCAHVTTKEEYLAEIARTNKSHRVKSMLYEVRKDGKIHQKSTGPDALRGVRESMIRRVTRVPNRYGTGTHPVQIGSIKQVVFQEITILG